MGEGEWADCNFVGFEWPFCVSVAVGYADKLVAARGFGFRFRVWKRKTRGYRESLFTRQ